MASDDRINDAEQRLRAALDRIAEAAADGMTRIAPEHGRDEPDISLAEVTDRLDAMIARLRAALAKT